MSTREIPDQKAIAREMFVEQAAHSKAEVRLAHCAGIPFAPSGVVGITFLNRRRGRLSNLQIHHCFWYPELMLQTSCESCGSWRL